MNNFSSIEALAVVAAEAALSIAFEAIFRNLSSQDVLKYARRNKVESEVDRLKNVLREMKCVLDDAEERQMSEDRIKTWLDELRNLTYDAEDILDEFSTEVMREKVVAETEAPPSKVRKLFPTCSPRNIKFNWCMGSKLDKIAQRFERLDKEKEALKLIDSTTRKLGAPVRIEEATSVPESHVYGREADKETLISKLLNGDYNGEPVSVVAIVGMGGLGKTTMARLLYNDDTVERSFNIKAWVCVSDEFDVLKITQKIIHGVERSCCNDMNLNSVQEKLRDAVHGKKFLLILDDVWNEDYFLWEDLIRPLAAGGLGSRVLITTRNEDVATTAGVKCFMYRLKKLNPEECTSLLARHALGANDFSGHPTLKEIGEEIAKKCDGLPLATKAIGGLLRGKSDRREWSKVLKSNMWELPQNKCPIMPALRVSYHYLPSHLKRCFAYCAIFPKDYIFDKDDLILWWMAEGFLEQSIDFMEVGSGYFQELLSMSFFQPSSDEDSRFVMHDLMNDLAMWISGGICLHLPRDKESASGLKFESLRHLSFMSNNIEDAKRFEKFSSSTGLRTFIAFGGFRSHFSNDIFSNMTVNMRCLKLLCLSGYDIEKLPDSISELKLLRHLDVSNTKIRLLPESISNLLNLQILKLNGCRNLIQLPQEIRKLINLQILDIKETNNLKEMPSGIGRLVNLQILPKFIVGENHGLRLNELKELSHIRGELSISRLENVVDIQDIRDANLKAKEGLVSLEFKWSASLGALEEEKDVQILAELRPHTSLKSLKIAGYNGKHFSSWVGDSNFTNLETLTLLNCNSASSLPSLGGLSSLKTLNIHGHVLIGKLPNKLPLQQLSIEGHSNLTNLPNKLPLLRRLSIEGSSNFTNLPNELPSLRRLSIEGSSNLTNLPNELPSLRRLSIEGSSNFTNLLNELPSLRRLSIEGDSNLTINQLPLLEELSIEGDSNLTNLPNELPLLRRLSIGGSSNLTNLPNELPPLRRLSIGGSSNLTNLPNELPSLRRLSIGGSSNLTNLPNQLPLLEELSIEGDSNLTNLPNELHLLRRLCIEGHLNFINLPNEVLLNLRSSIEECSNLTNFVNQLPLLRRWTIEGCSNLTNLPNQLPLPEGLSIEGCSNLTNLSNEFPLFLRLILDRSSNLTNLPNRFPLLEELRIGGDLNLTNLANPLPLLEELSIGGSSNLTNLPDELPLLEELSIGGNSNLTNLLGLHPLLEEFNIEGRSNFTNLRNEPPLLDKLSIEGRSVFTNLSDELRLLKELSIEGRSDLKNLVNRLSLVGELSNEGCSTETDSWRFQMS